MFYALFLGYYVAYRLPSEVEPTEKEKDVAAAMSELRGELDDLKVRIDRLRATL